MTTKVSFLIWLFFVSFFSGCSAQKPENKKAVESSPQKFSEQMIVKPLPVIEINEIQTSGSSATLKVAAQTPDMCWEFSHYEVKKAAGKWLITIYGKRDPAKMCAQMIGTMQAEIKLDFPGKGHYDCLFWQGDTETLQKTISLAD